jgi:hypothetical protein
MFDINKTVDLIKGGLTDPRATWQSYATENRSWQDTATLLALPLIIGSWILAGILSLIFRSYSLFGMGMGFGYWLIGLVFAIIDIAVSTVIFSYLAGVFKGKNDINKGLAALSLAAVPGYAGNVVGPIPFIGWIIVLALWIVTLVFMYQIIPLYLEVPEDKRAVHYVVSIVASIVAILIIAVALRGMGLMPMHRGMSGLAVTGQTPVQVGMLGDFQRYADLTEKAQQDHYDPPADGKITDAQMKEYMDVMRKAAGVRNDQMARIQRLKDKYQDKQPTATDLPTLAGGIGSALNAFDAEMEVVMTGKGNWAEHQWITEQLHTARIQKDANDAVKHNYALYQANAVELEKLSAIP